MVAWHVSDLPVPCPIIDRSCHMFSVSRYLYSSGLFGVWSASIRQVNLVSRAMAVYRPRPCVFCGPSGSGKSTLISKLMNEYKSYFGFSVSHTTRKPRPGEQDGVHYHFTTREWMQDAIKRGEFIESAEFSGNLYGTSKKAVEDVLNKNKICILDIETQGVMQIQKTNFKPIYIFIKPPSMNVLEERLRNRKTDTEDAIQKRLQTAKKEMEFISQQQGTGHTIVNDDVDSAYSGLEGALRDEIQRLKDTQDVQQQTESTNSHIVVNDNSDIAFEKLRGILSSPISTLKDLKYKTKTLIDSDA